MIIHHPNGFLFLFRSPQDEEYQVSCFFNRTNPANRGVRGELNTYVVNNMLVRFQKPRYETLIGRFIEYKTYAPENNFEEISSEGDGERSYDSLIDLLADTDRFIKKFDLKD